MTFLMPSPMRGAAPSFMTTVAVIPALINTPGGVRDVDADRNALRQSHPGECGIDRRGSGPSLLSWSVMPIDMPETVPCSAGDPSMR